MDFRKAVDAQPTVARMTAEVRGRLESLLFSRYPNRECLRQKKMMKKRHVWRSFFLTADLTPRRL
jgi:hypothetical protein